MSRFAVAPRYRGLAYAPTHAIGNESKLIQRNMEEFFDAVVRNVVSIQPRLDALRRLDTIADEYSHENWDGDGAAAISPETVREAAKFLTALPLSVRTPDIVAEP